MFGRSRKKEDEERCCAFCVYAKTGGKVCRCEKKNKETAEDAVCSSFEYDLLKRSPAPYRPLQAPDELSEGVL